MPDRREGDEKVNKFIQNEFLRLVMAAMFDADKANMYACGHEQHETNLSAALSYAGSCIAKSSAARAIYISRIEELGHYSIKDLFHQFDVFVSELQRYSFSHCVLDSTAWTNVEYDKLKELFDSSACAEPIQE